MSRDECAHLLFDFARLRVVRSLVIGSCAMAGGESGLDRAGKAVVRTRGQVIIKTTMRRIGAFCGIVKVPKLYA